MKQQKTSTGKINELQFEALRKFFYTTGIKVSSPERKIKAVSYQPLKIHQV